MKRLKFSIIIPWYQGTISNYRFESMLDSLIKQRDKDFEVLIYHDGELIREIPKIISGKINYLKAQLTICIPRSDDYGHSLRDIGIYDAKGEYIIHLNADNYLYNCLHLIKSVIKNSREEIFIFQVNMMDLNIVSKNKKDDSIRVTKKLKNFDKRGGVVTLKGIPEKGNIDVMQLVTTTKLWKEIGGWYDKSMNSDGIIYPKMCREHSYKICNIIMGEHW